MKIEIEQLETTKEAAPLSGVGFARAGGVVKAVSDMYPELAVKPVLLANIDKKNVAMLRAYAKGKAPGNFIEVMACEGGCISGPCGKMDYAKALKLFRKQMGETA